MEKLSNNESISINRDKDVNKNLTPARLSSTEMVLIHLRGKNIYKKTLCFDKTLVIHVCQKVLKVNVTQLNY